MGERGLLEESAHIGKYSKEKKRNQERGGLS